MNEFKKIQKLIARNEQAIAAYRGAGASIYYRPARNNEGWFVRLMQKHNIPPACENPLTPGTVSVLMVQD
ncbi:hypothetical protein [Rhizobium multihospitium]|uniref:hypothetical protein n=1 Tax=Rhizobium multihospitium TaxID=410764 RepID=UPI000B83B957|nr:hypothetical protein [Rhizobium multihospitium]